MKVTQGEIPVETDEDTKPSGRLRSEIADERDVSASDDGVSQDVEVMDGR